MTGSMDYASSVAFFRAARRAVRLGRDRAILFECLRKLPVLASAFNERVIWANNVYLGFIHSRCAFEGLGEKAKCLGLDFLYVYCAIRPSGNDFLAQALVPQVLSYERERVGERGLLLVIPGC